ncbi:lipid II flippase MurJ [Bacillus cereus]
MGRESSQEHTKRFLIVTLFFTLGTALGKLLGFAKEITLGAYFGTNHAVDAYVVALNIPTIVFTGITGAFAFSFIPIFMELKGKDSLKAYRFMNNFLNIVLLIFSFRFCSLNYSRTYLFQYLQMGSQSKQLYYQLTYYKSFSQLYSVHS